MSWYKCGEVGQVLVAGQNSPVLGYFWKKLLRGHSMIFENRSGSASGLRRRTVLAGEYSLFGSCRSSGARRRVTSNSLPPHLESDTSVAFGKIVTSAPHEASSGIFLMLQGSRKHHNALLLGLRADTNNPNNLYPPSAWTLAQEARKQRNDPN